MNGRLICIKILHTIIWLFFVLILGYVFYAGIYNKIDYRLFVAIGLVIAKGAVLIIFKGKCPLTYIAYRYTESR